MKEQVKLGGQVWKMYLDGNSKSAIAKALEIQRNEVIAIIKYTTADMYLDVTDTITEKEKEYQELRAKAKRIISQKKKTITALEDELSELKETKFSFMGKKVL